MAAVRIYEGYPDAENVPVKCYEGTVTKSDVIKGGLTVDDAITYSAPLQKGDLFKVKDDSSGEGYIVVEKVTLGSSEVNDAHGMLVDAPRGDDQVTATSGTPANADRRIATARFFGSKLVVMNVSATAAIRAGYTIVYDEAAEGIKEGSTTLANGSAVNLANTAAGGKAPVLIGYGGFNPAD